ncbi:MAG: iron-sulfur cluster assembly accessory protein [Cyanobacteriota bacterium]|nr:iron-sulfur cluster assembly accessory protein [Cyanobacteriota bacterium]
MIHLRASALQELQRLLQKQPQPTHRLRLALQAGGCAAWTYELSPAFTLEAGDTQVNCGEIEILLSADVLPLVTGLTIDYAEDLMGGGFRFSNPQAGYTCGCGHAFSLSSPPPNDPVADCLAQGAG